MNTKNKLILVVDDEKDIRNIITYNLEKEGMRFIEASNGDEALILLKKNPSLVILDVMMPGKDGYEICKHIRNTGSIVPIIFLTAMDREFDEVKGLESGGDDYIRKPFSPALLIARIKSILRRIESINMKGNLIEFDGLSINTETYIAQVDGNELTLPRKEFELLFLLASEPGKVFKRNLIMDSVWGKDVIVGDRTIDVHIRKLREKIGDHYFKTVKGVGYKLVD